MKLSAIFTPCFWLIFLPSVISLAQLSPRKRLTSSKHMLSRRDTLLLGPAAAASVAFGLTSPAQAGAAESPITLNGLLAGLKGIPTFCIVNSKDGAAYMVVKRDERMARGYAFTTFEGALAVLADAKRAAEKGGYQDLWEDATVTTIPADIAMRLALQKKERFSQKQQSLDTTIDIIPGADDRDDAVALDKSFSDQAKVPLFYIDGLRLQGDETPVYFRKRDLLSEWQRQNPDQTPPKIKMLDLVDTFQYVLRGRIDSLPKGGIIFVPSQDAIEAAAELKKRGLAPYKVDRMIV